MCFNYWSSFKNLRHVAYMFWRRHRTLKPFTEPVIVGCCLWWVQWLLLFCYIHNTYDRCGAVRYFVCNCCLCRSDDTAASDPVSRMKADGSKRDQHYDSSCHKVQSPFDSPQSPVNSIQSPVNSLHSQVTSLQSPGNNLQSPVNIQQSLVNSSFTCTWDWLRAELRYRCLISDIWWQSVGNDCVCIYIYIYVSLSISFSWSLLSVWNNWAFGRFQLLLIRK